MVNFIDLGFLFIITVQYEIIYNILQINRRV